MRHVSTRMLPALLAVLCMSAVVTAGASAATKKGELVNEKGAALVQNKITGSGKNALLEANGGRWECTSAALAETMTSSRAGTGTLTLAGCEFEIACKTVGAKNMNEWVLPLTTAISTEKERDVIVSQVPELALKCSGAYPLKIRGSLSIGGLTEEKLITETGLKLQNEPTSLEISLDEKPFQKLSISESIEAKFEEKAKFV